MNVAATLPRLRYTSGTLEALKWFAFACMIVDHVNTVMFDRTLGVAAVIVGRLAFPIFAVVFGYNMARPGVDHLRTAMRLGVVGALATPVYAPLLGWWPLNVLFTFAAACIVLHLAQRGSGWFAAALAVVLGCWVDYLWPGLALVFAAYAYARKSGPVAVALAAFAFAGMAVLNASVAGVWSLLALPLLACASRIDVDVPRHRWAFLAAYPLHLAVLLMLRG